MRRIAPEAWALLAVGMALVVMAILVGNHFRLAERFVLDSRGVRAPATVENREGDAYLLRFEHDSGAIYRTRYNGPFWPSAPSTLPSNIIVAYDPARPSHFQPAGASYVATALTASLFFAGMLLVFRARRRLLRRL